MMALNAIEVDHFRNDNSIFRRSHLNSLDNVMNEL